MSGMVRRMKFLVWDLLVMAGMVPHPCSFEVLIAELVVTNTEGQIGQRVTANFQRACGTTTLPSVKPDVAVSNVASIAVGELSKVLLVTQVSLLTDTLIALDGIRWACDES